MDWLKDKKNQPIVAGIAIGVLVIVGVCLWLFVFRAPADTAGSMDQTAQQQVPDATNPAGPAGPAPDQNATAPGTGAPTPNVGDVPQSGGAQPGASTPVAAPAAPAAKGTQVASVTPMETWRADPFQPIGYKPQKKQNIKPHIRDFPFERLPIRVVWNEKGEDIRKQKPEIQQPSRRMAGILLNDRVYAIIESNGMSQVVQPGDYTTDRLATVERIEPDKVVLKTVDAKPRYITVKMAASPTVQSPVASPNTVNGPMPVGPRRGGRAGFPPPPGMAAPGEIQ